VWNLYRFEWKQFVVVGFLMELCEFCLFWLAFLWLILHCMFRFLYVHKVDFMPVIFMWKLGLKSGYNLKKCCEKLGKVVKFVCFWSEISSLCCNA
jgi:hypothetical protein